MKNKKIAIVAVVAAAALAAGAWYVASQGARPAAPETGAGAGRGAGGQPPTLVNVVKVRRKDVPVTLQANGTVTPVSSVELHPQTTSTIRQVHIKEGQFVRKGELMFTLDDRSERADVDKARAQLARDRAALADLERQLRRSEELLAQNFIARSASDTLRSQVESARALLVADSAALHAARVEASHASISAPLAGRVGAINVFPGSLVQLATPLTSVTQIDPINVAFTVPESSLAELLAAHKAGTVAVEALLPGQDAKLAGKLGFIDNTVDAAAGAIRVKALFDNAGTRLWPGQYVTTRVTVRTLKDATVVPQAAIVTNARGTFVYAVGAGQEAVQKPVQRLHAFGLDAAVSGLDGSETVITEGKQNLRPGAKLRVAESNGNGAGKGGRAKGAQP